MPSESGGERIPTNQSLLAISLCPEISDMSFSRICGLKLYYSSNDKHCWNDLEFKNDCKNSVHLYVYM